MSTITEAFRVARLCLKRAEESLGRAEEDFRNWRTANPQDFTSPGFLALSAEVTACRAMLAGAHQTIQSLAALRTEQRITLHEYLQSVPPLPTYSNTLPGPTSTTPPAVRNPQLTLHWETFEQEVMDFVRSEIEHNAQTVSPPVFGMLGIQVRSEVPVLQISVAQNLLQFVATHVGRTVWATERGKAIGNPDGYIVDDTSKSTCVVYEIKGKWTLKPEWFEHGRIDMFVGQDLVLDAPHNALRSAVVQLYTYMVLNQLQFGILSSFDYTFFFKRVKVENAVDGFEQLFISTGIAHDATNPTVFQSIAYLLSLADGTPFPPPTLGESLGNSRSSRINTAPTLFESGNQHDPIQDATGSSFDFALEDFNIKSILGYGRTKVYYEAKHQLALKAIDLWKQSKMLPELHNEIEIYRLLSDLQGISIPKLVLHGYWEGGMYVIGFSLCGTVPKSLSESQKQSVVSILETIHSRGIIHNDIKKENILVDENARVYLIDFGFATLDSCYETQQNEMQQLLMCIDSL